MPFQRSGESGKAGMKTAWMQCLVAVGLASMVALSSPIGCALPHLHRPDDGSGGAGQSGSNGFGGDGSGGEEASGGSGGASGGSSGSGGSGTCTPDERECDEDGVTPRTCNEDGEWEDETECPVLCTNGQCETSCTNQDTQCAGKKLLVCTSGAWQEDESCTYVCNGELDPPACDGECVPRTTA